MTPDKARNMTGYARVSRVGGRESYASPEIQRKAIEEWGKRHGVAITEVIVDEDQSGGTQNRPGLREVMRRIEEAETDGLVCYKLDRFARTVAGAYDDLEKIKAADAHLVCVADGELIDTTTPGGKAMLGVMLVFAEFTLDTLKAGWKVSKARAVERGAHIGPVPFGYRRVLDGDAKGTLEPDGDPLTEVDEDGEVVESAGIVTYTGKAGVVQQAYELAREPDGIGRAVKQLEKLAPGHRWTATTLRRLLANRVYRGEVSYGEGLVNAEAHKPLVAESVWKLAQTGPRWSRRPNAQFALTGVVRCASCGGPMAGARLGSKPAKRGYRCTAWQRVRRGEDPCTAAVSVMAEPLEEYVRDELTRKLAGNGNGRALADAVAELKDAQAALQTAEEHLLSLAGADATRREALGGSAGWERALTQATVERDEVLERVGRAQQAIYSRGKTSAADKLRSGTTDAFALAVKQTVKAITVVKGRGKLGERVTIELH
ncbi:MAG: site-specific recombinase [Thermoleophilaceae bacterium]|jgi:DNA invertase Pin-like site-specific DNA recombinase|nr:site-specific recombinase [Thermoleophilaceae bacterium]